MICVDELTMRAGEFRLDRISFKIPKGQYGVIMGKTGCGKTSVMEAICGLKPVVSGMIILGDKDVTHMRTGDRGVGFLPQDIALFNSMTVEEHIAFGPRVHHWPKPLISEIVRELADELEIPHLLQRKPHGLSGGEKQRVALGRALALQPSTLLLDEPLSALDEDTRESMCKLLKTIQAHTGVTIMHVTHSRQEAERLADCVFRFEDGKVHELPTSNAQRSTFT